MADSRLDAALADRGLARSRTHAARLIADGLVTVDGAPVVKPSMRVTEAQQLHVDSTDHWVSRAAHKLLAALDEFPVAVEGRLALDVGASTGGFTQVLLERGVREVIALDVGHGQLARTVADDARVRSVEGFNARSMTAETLAAASGTDETPTLVVGDLSFISLTHVLPALVATCGRDADYVLLIKPQFEVGRTGVREGIVKDAALRREAIETVLWAAHDAGLATAGLRSSPIAGTAGNREYLVWFNAAVGTDPSQWDAQTGAIA